MIDFIEKIQEDKNLSIINRKLNEPSLSSTEVAYTQSVDDWFKLIENETNLSKDQIDKLKKQIVLTNELLGLSSDIDLLHKELTDSLANQLKDYEFEVDIGDDNLVLKAVKKIYKKPLKKINYEMYKEAKMKLNKINQEKLESV